jgi:phage/plasmid-associated DNA primase
MDDTPDNIADFAKACLKKKPRKSTPVGRKATFTDTAGGGFYEIVENSEIDLALRFVAEHYENFRHVAAWGKWLEWNRFWWKTETTLKVWDLARLTCLSAANTAAPAEANRIARANTIAAVERISKADRIVAATKDQWDLDEFLINQKYTKHDTQP